MIVECPHCKSLLRTESQALEGVPIVRCGACLGSFDALEHIKLDAAVDPVTVDGAPFVRQRVVLGASRDGVPDGGTRTGARHSTLSPSSGFVWPRRTGLWLALAVCGLLLLGLHVGRDRLAETPTGHTVVSTWCGWVGCTVAPATDYTAIRLIRRQIYAHPDREDALVVSLAMVNDAHFAQDFPTLMVRMTDRAGSVVAQGEFAPADYLDDFDTSVLMQPGRAVDVQLDVRDPGTEAVSFDLEFQ